MPQIDTPLLLDVLLGLIILLFVPFGIRRGVAKEAMVSAGILLGATLAERFGETVARELGARLGLEPAVATFTSSALLILGTTFLLGYGGGAALGVTRPGVLSRLSGGVLAAFNGALLLSYLLSWIERDLRPTSLLDSGVISEALLRQSSQLMLYGAGVLLAMTVVAWIVNALRARRQPHELSGELSGLPPSRKRPVRVASNAEAGKFEPGPEASAPSGRFAATVDSTAPIGAYTHGGSWSETEYQDRLANGHSRDPDVDAMGLFSAAARGAEGDETVWTAWSATGPGDQAAAPRGSSRWPVPPSQGVTGDERCAVCRARVGSRDVFCPECGATL